MMGECTFARLTDGEGAYSGGAESACFDRHI